MVTALFNSAWLATNLPHWMRFRQALKSPAAAQSRLLQTYLQENENTAFGRAHRFDQIHSHERFAGDVPSRDYDDLAPWIDQIRGGESNVLSRDPVTRLVPSSGSTAARKLIPFNATLQNEFARAIGAWMSDLHLTHPGMIRGKSYWSVSPIVDMIPEETSAVPIGFEDDAAYLGGWRRRLIQRVAEVPAALARAGSVELVRYATLLRLLRTPQLALISVWHPSFLTRLLEEMERNWKRLVQDVRHGSCDPLDALPSDLRPLVTALPDSARAAELDRHGPVVPRVWPHLRIVSCWTDAAAETPAAQLSQRLSGILLQPKGLLATEGVVSIPFGAVRPLAVTSHFFEFVESNGRIRRAHELDRGGDYEVLLTTGGGLYRYRLHDLVRVDGFVGLTPSVRFIGRSSLIVDLVGEKLSEGFVSHCLTQLFYQFPPRTAFAMLAPCTSREPPSYVLYVDAALPPEAVMALESLLRANPHYAIARSQSQLGAAEVLQVRDGAYDRFAGRLVQNGQRLGDVKPTVLSRLAGWDGFFEKGTHYERSS